MERDDYMSPDLGRGIERRIENKPKEDRAINEIQEESSAVDKNWKINYIVLTEDPPEEHTIFIKSHVLPSLDEIKSEITIKRKHLASKWASISVTKTQQYATSFDS